MPVRSLEQAQADLGKYVPDICERVKKANTLLMETMGPALKSLETRTKRGAVRDFIVEQLWSWAEQTDGVQPQKSGNLKWLGFNNNWIVRVKYLNERDEVAVSPTEDSYEYDCNEVPETVETFLEEGPATTLYLGWRTNDNAPTVPVVSLVCNNSAGEVEWVWPLVGGGATQPGLALPEPDVGPAAPAVKIKITGRKKSSTG